MPTSIDVCLFMTTLGYSTQQVYDHQDKWKYVLHKILERRIFDSSIEPDGYVNLHFDTLTKFLGKNYTKKILREMMQVGLIECDYKKLYGSYGSKSYGYRVAAQYRSKAILHDVFKEEVFGRELRAASYRYKQQRSKSTTWKNLTKIGIRAQQAKAYVDDKLATSLTMLASFLPQMQLTMNKGNKNIILSVYASIYAQYGQRQDELSSSKRYATQFSSFQSSFSLITPTSIEKACLDTNNQGVNLDKYVESFLAEKHELEHKSIDKIDKGEYFLEQPDPASRIFTNVANLSSDLRQFLYHKQYPGHWNLVNLDIANSQPYLLSLLLRARYQGQEMPESVRRYIEFTATGTFYEEMMTIMGYATGTITKRQRSAFKKDFFGKLFFCKTRYSRLTPEGKMFRKHFKEVAALIDEYKDAGHEQLAITMQRAEAKVILKTIGEELIKRGIWFTTIHDSVLTLTQHHEEVKQLILSAFFTEVGIAPKISSEPLAETCPLYPGEELDVTYAPVQQDSHAAVDVDAMIARIEADFNHRLAQPLPAEYTLLDHHSCSTVSEDDFWQ